MKVKTILKSIHRWCDPRFTASWDNTGLQVGDAEADVSGIVTVLDVDSEAVQYALENTCNVIVSHHPLIFGALKVLTAKNPVEHLVRLLIKNDISLIAAHTNFDTAPGGVNDELCRLAGIINTEIFEETGAYKTYKAVCFIPHDYAEKVKAELAGLAGVAVVGEYSKVMFSVNGTGEFTPSENASPATGNPGIHEQVSEIRVEFQCSEQGLGLLKQTYHAVHPYEEPVMDVYELWNKKERYGLGRIGMLDSPSTLAEYSVFCKNALNCDFVSVTGNPSKTVQKIAVCSGSGASLIKKAASRGCDALLTGDCKYHDARLAEQMGIAVIDCGHFFTEIPSIYKMADYLKSEHDSVKILPFAQKSPFWLAGV